MSKPRLVAVTAPFVPRLVPVPRCTWLPLAVAMTGVLVLLMSAFIRFAISNIIHDCEAKHAIATVTLVVSSFNVLAGLLHLPGFMNSYQ